jgi:integral membrane protein (TIGR01906 family)
MPRMHPLRFLGSVALGLATALVIPAIVVAPFLSPAWIGFEQDRSGAVLWTGFAHDDLRSVTNAILADLVIGPPAFDVELNGSPVLNPAERSHMRDVRGVFSGFYLAAAAGLAVLAGAAIAARARPEARADAWRAVRGGALALAGLIAVAGVLVTVAFDAAFEVFHRLFFPAGTYNFDPRTDRLVQLFPEALFSETATVVGTLILVLAIGLAIAAGRRARAAAGARGPASSR